MLLDYVGDRQAISWEILFYGWKKYLLFLVQIIFFLFIAIIHTNVTANVAAYGSATLVAISAAIP